MEILAMMDLKTRLSALLTYDGDDDESESISDNSPEKISFAEPAVNTLVESNTTYYGVSSVANTSDELPLYEATTLEINRWHAFGFNLFLQTLLKEYDLGGYDSWTTWAFERFKIGMNYEQHEAIFAVDDTHFYKIPFDKFNATPMDKQQARCVLEKVSRLRDEICGGADKRYFRATIATGTDGLPKHWQIERKNFT